MRRRFPLGFAVLAASIIGLLCHTHALMADTTIPDISGATFQLNTNGTVPAPTIVGSVLTLTHLNANIEDNSAIYNGGTVPINNFTVSFTYQESPAAAADASGSINPADGVTFVIENDPAGLSALGGLGSGLGYGNSDGDNGGKFINDSVAIELNVYDEHVVGTNLGINGTWGAYNLTGSVFLNSGDPIAVTLSYDGTTLQEDLEDLTTLATYDTSYTVDIPSIVGNGGMAYVGFTGGTGADTSTQTISDFSFDGSATAVPLPRGASTGLAMLAALGLFSLARRRTAHSV